MKITRVANAAGARPQTTASKNISKPAPSSLSSYAGQRPSKAQTIKVGIRLDATDGAAGAVSTVKQSVDLSKSDRMKNIMHDAVVQVQKGNAKQANNVSDIEGTKPKNKHKARNNTAASSLNCSDIQGAKTGNTHQPFKRKHIRNPLDPIMETPVVDHDSTVLGGSLTSQASQRTFDEGKMSKIQKVSLGGNMRESMDYSQVFENKEKIKQRVVKRPVQKAEIEGTKPKPRTYNRDNTNYNSYEAKDIEGSAPKTCKKRQLCKPVIETEGVAGLRPQAKSSLQVFTPKNRKSLANLIFGADPETQS